MKSAVGAIRRVALRATLCGPESRTPQRDSPFRNPFALAGEPPFRNRRADPFQREESGTSCAGAASFRTLCRRASAEHPGNPPQPGTRPRQRVAEGVGVREKSSGFSGWRSESELLLWWNVREHRTGELEAGIQRRTLTPVQCLDLLAAFQSPPQTSTNSISSNSTW